MRSEIEALIAKLREAETAEVPDEDEDPRWYVGYAAAARYIADRLTAILADDAVGWRPARELPEHLAASVVIELWSAAHVQQGQEPYPGGGWLRQFTAPPASLWPGVGEYLLEVGYSHFRLPEPPPQEPPR